MSEPRSEAARAASESSFDWCGASADAPAAPESAPPAAAAAASAEPYYTEVGALMGEPAPVAAPAPLCGAAEVLLVLTSLQADTLTYFRGLNLKHLLKCHCVRFYEVDLNQDSVAALRLQNNELLQQLQAVSESVVPELIVDGVSLGSFESVVELENENLLGALLARSLCSMCFAARSGAVCASCGHDFRCFVDATLAEHLVVYEPKARAIDADAIAAAVLCRAVPPRPSAAEGAR